MHVNSKKWRKCSFYEVSFLEKHVGKSNTGARTCVVIQLLRGSQGA
jgi:hypothetical protein